MELGLYGKESLTLYFFIRKCTTRVEAVHSSLWTRRQVCESGKLCAAAAAIGLLHILDLQLTSCIFCLLGNLLWCVPAQKAHIFYGLDTYIHKKCFPLTWKRLGQFRMILVGWELIYDDFGWLGPNLR